MTIKAREKSSHHGPERILNGTDSSRSLNSLVSAITLDQGLIMSSSLDNSFDESTSRRFYHETNSNNFLGKAPECNTSRHSQERDLEKQQQQQQQQQHHRRTASWSSCDSDVEGESLISISERFQANPSPEQVGQMEISLPRRTPSMESFEALQDSFIISPDPRRRMQRRLTPTIEKGLSDSDCDTSVSEESSSTSNHCTTSLPRKPVVEIQEIAPSASGVVRNSRYLQDLQDSISTIDSDEMLLSLLACYQSHASISSSKKSMNSTSSTRRAHRPRHDGANTNSVTSTSSITTIDSLRGKKHLPLPPSLDMAVSRFHSDSSPFPIFKRLAPMTKPVRQHSGGKRPSRTSPLDDAADEFAQAITLVSNQTESLQDLLMSTENDRPQPRQSNSKEVVRKMDQFSRQDRGMDVPPRFPAQQVVSMAVDGKRFTNDSQEIKEGAPSQAAAHHEENLVRLAKGEESRRPRPRSSKELFITMDQPNCTLMDDVPPQHIPHSPEEIHEFIVALASESTAPRPRRRNSWDMQKSMDYPELEGQDPRRRNSSDMLKAEQEIEVSLPEALETLLPSQDQNQNFSFPRMPQRQRSRGKARLHKEDNVQSPPSMPVRKTSVQDMQVLRRAKKGTRGMV